MYCDYLLNKHIEKQFRAFKKGFDKVVDTDLIKVLIPINADSQARGTGDNHLWQISD